MSRFWKVTGTTIFFGGRMIPIYKTWLPVVVWSTEEGYLYWSGARFIL